MLSNKNKILGELLCVFLLLLYISLGTMVSVYSTIVPFIDWARLLLTFWGIMMIAKTWGIVRNRKNIVFAILLYMLVLILSSTVYKHAGDFRPESIREISDSIMWIAVIFMSYRIGYRNEKTIEYIPYLAWVIPLFAFAFFNIYTFFMFVEDQTAMISTAYYPLFMMPMVLMSKKRVVKTILLVLIFIIILLSSKRGGLVAFSGALVVDFFISIKRKKSVEKILLMLVGGILTLSVLTVLVGFFVEEFDLSIFERMSNIKEDGGSDRDQVWAHTWKMIHEETNILLLLFGHGYNAVYSNSSLELSAHNDFLEVIYDYGVFGFFLYIILFVELYGYYIRIKRVIPECTGPFAASIVMALLISFVSHLVINPTLFAFLCLFWGICLGVCDKKRKIKYEKSC